MKISLIVLISGLLDSALAGTNTICEELQANFARFLVVYSDFVHAMVTGKNSSIEYPVLTAAENVAFTCQLRDSLTLVANVVAMYTNNQVESSTALAILQGYSSPPFNIPLSCISNELIDIQRQTDLIINNLPSPPPYTSGPPMNCFDVAVTLGSSFGNFLPLGTKEYERIMAAKASFNSIGLGDEYLRTLNVDCASSIIGAAAGPLLNADPQQLIDYIDGKTTTLSEPFSCLQSIIDLFKSILTTDYGGSSGHNFQMTKATN